MTTNILSKPPRFSGFTLAAELLRRAGYKVDISGDYLCHPILVVYDPVYQYFPKEGEFMFSHINTVHLKGTEQQSILVQAAQFIDARS